MGSFDQVNKCKMKSPLMRRARQRATTSIGLFVVFVAFLSLAPSVAVAFESHDGTYPNCIAISIGPSYSSVGIIQHGARRVPFDGQSFTILDIEDTSCSLDYDPTLANALFNTSQMICATAEPEYFFHRVIKNPQSLEYTIDAQQGGHIHDDVLPEILVRMKEIAESWTQDTVKFAIVSVPAYFDENHRSAVKKAGESVGLKVFRVMNASTAAGIGYNMDYKDHESNLLVYDLGRETFDVSLFETEWGAFDRLAMASDPQLGKSIGELVQRRRRAGRSYFNAADMRLFEQTLVYVDQVIQDANLSKSDVTDFIVTGDYVRESQVRSMVEALFHGKRAAVPYFSDSYRKRPAALDNDEAVTWGTAIVAQIFIGQEEGLMGAFSMQTRSLSVETIGGGALNMIQRYTILPASKIMNFTTTVDNQSTAVISVFQGELPEARKNDEALTLKLPCIPPAPRGVPRIKLALDIYEDDASRIMLNATAHLLGNKGDCFDSATSVLYENDGLNVLEAKDLDLEAAYKENSVEPVTCPNRQTELGHHYIMAEEIQNLNDHRFSRLASEWKHHDPESALEFFEKALPYFSIGNQVLMNEIKEVRKRLLENSG